MFRPADSMPAAGNGPRGSIHCGGASAGTLLVGVADDGTVVGIEEDFPFLGKKKDADGWELWLTNLLCTSLGKTAAADVLVTLGHLDRRTVARIDVGPAARPVFASNSRDRPAFLVRINNSTHELAGREAHDYQRIRWPA